MAAAYPFVDLPLVGGGTIALTSNLTASVRQDPSDPDRCYIDTVSQGSEPWYVALSSDAATLALVTGFGPSTPQRIIAGATVDALGTIVAGFNLTALPYTPGSGDYAFSVSAPAGNWAVLVTASDDPPGIDIEWSAQQAAPPFVTVKARVGLSGTDATFQVVVVDLS
jgi:hypothetical protein